MWSADISPKSRRGILRRAVFSEEQRKELERTFRRQKYISKTDRNKLAADLSLKESQVIEHELPNFCLINLSDPKGHEAKKKKTCVHILCVHEAHSHILFYSSDVTIGAWLSSRKACLLH